MSRTSPRACIIYLIGVLSGVITPNVVLSLVSVAGAVLGAGLAFVFAGENFQAATESTLNSPAPQMPTRRSRSPSGPSGVNR